MARLGVPPQSYTLTTIAGWALKWAGHYPTISGVRNAQPTDTSEWNAVYEGARRVLANPHLAGSVRASYGGGFVDEYQDCTLHQHEISLALSELMPLRVLGDPLQGIFGFTKEPILWSRDVEPSFQALKVVSACSTSAADPAGSPSRQRARWLQTATGWRSWSGRWGSNPLT